MNQLRIDGSMTKRAMNSNRINQRQRRKATGLEIARAFPGKVDQLGLNSEDAALILSRRLAPVGSKLFTHDQRRKF